MINKIKVSELFYSLQGEGRFVGAPSIFLRTFGCNFTCDGFGMPPGERSQERHQIDASQFTALNQLPLVNSGCDSYASWDPRFKDLSPLLTVDAICNRMKELLPGGDWLQPNGNRVHLVITGGEPLLGWQQSYPELFQSQSNLKDITFETNGTKDIQTDLADYLEDANTNYYLDGDVEFTFSVSPKLSASGESWDRAIKPEVVASYEDYGFTYLKFVVNNQGHFNEVDQAVSEYRAAGFAGPVYVMPQGGITESYNENMGPMAELALQRGYFFSPRIHVSLWKNGWGR